MEGPHAAGIEVAACCECYHPCTNNSISIIQLFSGLDINTYHAGNVTINDVVSGYSCKVPNFSPILVCAMIADTSISKKMIALWLTRPPFARGID